MRSGKTSASLHEKLLQEDVLIELEKRASALVCDRLGDFPLAVLLDPTTECNLNCPWCIDRSTLGKGSFTTERLMSLISELATAGVKSVVLFGGGEPLMHPAIDGAIHSACEQGLQVALCTNGLLLGKHTKTIEQAVSWTRVSLDAGTASVYHAMHYTLAGGNKFQGIVDAMHALRQSAKGTVGASFVVMPQNADDILPATELMLGTGCDFIQFKPCYSPVPRLSDSQPYDACLRNVIQEQLDQGRKRAAAFPSFQFLVTKSLELALDPEMPEQTKTYRRCYAQQIVPLITPSGVYVCPNHRGETGMRLGDVNTMSFSDMWRHPRRISASLGIDPSQSCSFYCLRHKTNVLIDALVTAERQGLSLVSHLRSVAQESYTDAYFF